MELLVGLLVEVLFSFVAAVVPAIASFAAAVMVWIADLISEFAGSSGRQPEQPDGSDVKDQQDQVASSPADYVPSVAFRWIKRLSAGVFATIVVCLLVINLLFLKPIGNWALAKLEQRSGIEMSASGISGNLFTGSFKLTGLTAKREDDEKSSFDVKVAEVSGDLAISSLVFGTPVFDTLSVNGVSGRFDITKRDKNRKHRKIRTRRNFLVEHMMISDVALQLYNAKNQALDVSLTSVESKPLRSNYAVFDVFFRSNVSGTLAGRTLEIRSAATEGGRATTWNIDQLPVSVLAHFSDAPVISWLEQGTVDIKVTDTWKMTDRAKINMDWQLLANDVKMQVPADAGLVQKTLFLPAQNYLNRRDEPVDISFSLVMDEKRFEGAASLEAANLWKTVKDGFIKALAQKYRATEKQPVESDDQPPVSEDEKARGLVDRATDTFKTLLDKARKAPAPEN